MRQKPMIDELLEEHLPKRYYGHEARKRAKELALDFFKQAKLEYAQNDIFNRSLFLGRELTEDERKDVLKIWGLG